MNILKKTTLYFSLITSLVIPVFFLVPTQHASAVGCAKINNAYFESITTTSPVIKDGALSFNYPASTDPRIKVVVDTQNCAGLPINVRVIERGGISASVSVLNDQVYLVPTSNKLEFIIKPSEELCGSISGYKCEYKIEVSKTDILTGGIVGSSTFYKSADYETTGATKGYILNYNCKGSDCFDDGTWKIISTTGTKTSTDCVIKSAGFYTNFGPTPIDLRTGDNPGLELVLETQGCVGWMGSIELEEEDSSINNDALPNEPGHNLEFAFDKTGKNLTRVALIPGESHCDSDLSATITLGETVNCTIIANITPSFDGDTGDSYSIDKTLSTLRYNCKVQESCDPSAVWQLGDSYSLGDITKKTKVAQAIVPNGCTIISNGFDPDTATTKDGLADDSWFGGYKHGWFWEEKRDIVNLITLNIKTKGCAGGNLYVTIYGKEVDGDPTLSTPVKKMVYRAFTVPSSEEFKIKRMAGEEGCRDAIAMPGGADCKFNVKVSKVFVNNVWQVNDSINETYGNLNFECDGACDRSKVLWKFVSDTSAKPYISDPLNAEDPLSLEDNGGDAISPECRGTDGKAIDGCYQLYGGFAEVLKGKFDNINSLGDFINAIIALAIGIAGVITVGMVMIDGFTYWRAGKEGNEVALGVVKGRIWKRLLGLLLLFTIYTILRTINPDLLNLTPRINVVELQAASQSTLSPNDFTEITGKPLQSPSAYDAMAKEIAKTYSSDYCALRVIIQNESKGKPTVVGQDENVRDPGIPSRVAFVNSGKKYSGATFATAADLITKKGFCNDAAACAGDVPNPKSKTLGLDWRFTKGIGLTQITFYPNDYDNFKNPGFVPSYANKDIPPSREFNFSTGKETVTPFEMFDPEKNITISAKLWNEGIKKCGNPTGAFYTYACGKCDCGSNAFAKAAIATRVPQYNQCKKENP